MKFWIEFLLDKRFSLDFKIANLIMRDSLRNYLACVLLEIDMIKSINNEEMKKRYLNKIENNVQLLMNSNSK